MFIGGVLAPQILNLPTVKHLINSQTPRCFSSQDAVLTRPHFCLGKDSGFILEKAIANLQNEFSGEANTGELLDRVQQILPLENTEYKIVGVKGTGKNFKANIKVDLFVRNYVYKNNETLRILKPRKSENKTVKTVLTKYFRCLHNTRYEATKLPDQVLASKPTKPFKNTNCPFSLIVQIG